MKKIDDRNDLPPIKIIAAHEHWNPSMMKPIPRPEHPRPHFVREPWCTLNGEWTYAFDFGESGMEEGRAWFKSHGFADTILVPFCPESTLSGVGHKDFIPAMWYHRTITVPTEWSGKRFILHFGAVDYECEVFLDGQSLGLHFGGTVSFEFDLTRFVKVETEHHLVVRVRDQTRGANQPSGKQSPWFASRGCHYTRTTGIWQTVWLEAMDPCGLKGVQLLPDLDGGRFTLIPTYYGIKAGLRLQAHAEMDGRVVAESEVTAADGNAIVLTLGDVRAWCPSDPFLYDIVLRVTDAHGAILDDVRSYGGLRKVHVEGNRVFLNNRPLYQRLVLDQGFYPDGIWTAPSDDALKNDIVLSMNAGFNGARLHQKVFEERFHYWADKLGYLTWGESSSWGCDPNSIEGAAAFLGEWREIVVRDRNHPSIITWTPWNETGGYSNPKQHRRVHVDSYQLCHDLDPTRPVNDTSGWIHHVTDLWTVHSYNQTAEQLIKTLTPDPEHGVWRVLPKLEAAYTGQPYLVDEYGGIQWIASEKQRFADNSWGYGQGPKTVEEFHERLEGLTEVILSMEHICGYCYTQLTDVEQEQNGIYNYDRTAKFDMARIAAVFRQVPAAYR